MRQVGRPETMAQLILVQSAAVELDGARQDSQRQRFWDPESDCDDAEVVLARRRRESTLRRNILRKVAEKEEARRMFNCPTQESSQRVW